MGSGNFLIGRDCFGLKAFDKYVLPRLVKRGYSVPDKMTIEKNNGSVLISLVGEGELEKEVNEALVELGNLMVEDKLIPYEMNYSMIWDGDFEWQRGEIKYTNPRGIYEVLGIYDNDKKASQVFPELVSKLLAEEDEPRVVGIEYNLKGLVK